MYFPQNNILKAHRDGKKSYGMYVQSPSKRFIEMTAASGMNFVRLDLEGGIFDMESLGNMIMVARACGITPFVRVPQPLDETLIRRAISLGAMGIQLPEITSYEEVEYAVHATKTPPVGGYNGGHRSFITGFGLSGDEYNAWAQEHILLCVQIESKEAVERLDDILKIPGLDMVASGRGSLAKSYGYSSQYHPEMFRLERETMKKAIAMGKIASAAYSVLDDEGLYEHIKKCGEMGVSVFSLGVDRAMSAVLQRAVQKADAQFTQ